MDIKDFAKDLKDDFGSPLTMETVLRCIAVAAEYNGLDEIIADWSKLDADEFGCIGYPDYANPEYPKWAQNQLQVFWMILVLMFGDYGVSPRVGWIPAENVESFKKYTRYLKERKS